MPLPSLECIWDDAKITIRLCATCLWPANLEQSELSAIITDQSCLSSKKHTSCSKDAAKDKTSIDTGSNSYLQKIMMLLMMQMMLQASCSLEVGSGRTRRHGTSLCVTHKATGGIYNVDGLHVISL